MGLRWQVCCFGRPDDEVYQPYCNLGYVCNATLPGMDQTSSGIFNAVDVSLANPVCVPCGGSGGPPCDSFQDLSAATGKIRPSSPL